MPIDRDALHESSENIHTHSDAALSENSQAAVNGKTAAGSGNPPASQDSTTATTKRERAGSRERINDPSTTGAESNSRPANPLAFKGSNTEIGVTKATETKDQDSPLASKGSTTDVKVTRVAEIKDQAASQDNPLASKGSKTEVKSAAKGDGRNGVASTSSTLEWMDGRPLDGLPLLGPIMDTKI